LIAVVYGDQEGLLDKNEAATVRLIYRGDLAAISVGAQLRMLNRMKVGVGYTQRSRNPRAEIGRYWCTDGRR
jgi:hypothetical protein